MGIPEHPFVTAAKVRAEEAGKTKVKVAGIQAEARGKTATKTAGIRAASQEKIADMRVGIQEKRLDVQIASQEQRQEGAEQRTVTQKFKQREKTTKEVEALGRKVVVGPVTSAIQSLTKIKPLKLGMGIIHPDQLVKNTEPYFGEGSTGKVRMPNGKMYSGDWRDLLQPGRVEVREDAEAILAASKSGAMTANDLQQATELDSRRFRNALKFLQKSGFELMEEQR